MTVLVVWALKILLIVFGTQNIQNRNGVEIVNVNDSGGNMSSIILPIIVQIILNLKLIKLAVVGSLGVHVLCHVVVLVLVLVPVIVIISGIVPLAVPKMTVTVKTMTTMMMNNNKSLHVVETGMDQMTVKIMTRRIVNKIRIIKINFHVVGHSILLAIAIIWGQRNKIARMTQN